MNPPFAAVLQISFGPLTQPQFDLLRLNLAAYGIAGLGVFVADNAIEWRASLDAVRHAGEFSNSAIRAADLDAMLAKREGGA